MRWLALSMAAVLLVAGLVVSARSDRPNELPDTDGFIVHEWGTFTSFAGSDGVQLHFRPEISSELPSFVFDRDMQATGKHNEFAALLKGGYWVPVRMETPITYFYTPRPRQATVSVGFPQGLLTEFYPPVQTMLPAYNAAMRFPPVRHASLDWGTLDLIPDDDSPAARQARQKVPNSNVKHGAHYALARETESALVKAKGPWGEHYEKFLFYRGVAQFELPLVLTAEGADKFHLHNRGHHPVRHLFLVEIAQGQVRFAEYERVNARAELNMTLPAESASLDALAERMTQSLVASGLYEKEAQSMINTWRDSWFGEEGTRLLYLVPQSLTDRELPLSIKPEPQEMVRVLVGRMETLTPEFEAKFATLANQYAAGQDEASEKLNLALRPFGRFHDPIWQRIHALAAEKSPAKDSQKTGQ